MNECNDEICNNDIPCINLSEYNKNKTWIVFYLDTCNTCHFIIEYFKKNNFKFKTYNLENSEGLAKAAILGVIEKCKKFVPVIVEEED